MLEFFASYVWLSIGFMMAFIILFSNFKAFQGFPSPFVSGIILISDWSILTHTHLWLVSDCDDAGGAGVEGSLLSHQPHDEDAQWDRLGDTWGGRASAVSWHRCRLHHHVHPGLLPRDQQPPGGSGCLWYQGAAEDCQERSVDCPDWDDCISLPLPQIKLYLQNNATENKESCRQVGLQETMHE